MKIRCAPFVNRRWLMLAAGVLWSAVGIMLSIMACYWISGLDWPLNGIGVFVGFGSGVAIYRYGFSKIALKNIGRIEEKPDLACFFAFLSWRSYLLILLMILLGHTIRHAHLPLVVPAVIYAGIGTGLALASGLYYHRFSS